MEDYGFIIEGIVYTPSDTFQADPSVGIFGEDGWFVDNGEGHELFVTDGDYRVFCKTGRIDFCGDTGLIAERVRLENT